MRLRYGLEVDPTIGPNVATICFARKTDRTDCLANLDACAKQGQIGKVGGSGALYMLEIVRDRTIQSLKRQVTSLKTEQFIYELSQLDENTDNTNEARTDVIAETLHLRAMLDIRVFLSTLVSGC